MPAYSAYDNCIANHAEANALLYADRTAIEGGSLYVTDEPCRGCWKLIANSGLVRVAWPKGWSNAPFTITVEEADA